MFSVFPPSRTRPLMSTRWTTVLPRAAVGRPTPAVKMSRSNESHGRDIAAFDLAWSARHPAASSRNAIARERIWRFFDRVSGALKSTLRLPTHATIRRIVAQRLMRQLASDYYLSQQHSLDIRHT